MVITNHRYLPTVSVFLGAGGMAGYWLSQLKGVTVDDEMKVKP